MSAENQTDEKIDCEELLVKFKVPNSKADTFSFYLKEIWKDMSDRSTNKTQEGISKVTFSKYFQLPGIINDRLFAVFDIDCNGYLSRNEFVNGMTTLFLGEYAELIKFIFRLYDFDKNELITKEDIRIVLSYIPLKISNKFSIANFKFEQQDYQDRIESQEELISILNKLFQHETVLRIETYRNYVETVSSETFIYILIFLLEKKPFSYFSLFGYKTDKSESSNEILKNENSQENKSKYLIAEPSTNSKFSPGNTLENSPIIQKKRLSMQSINNNKTNQHLLNLIGSKPAFNHNSEIIKPVLINNPSINNDDIKPAFNELHARSKAHFNINIVNPQMKSITLNEIYEFKPEIKTPLE